MQGSLGQKGMLMRIDGSGDPLWHVTLPAGLAVEGLARTADGSTIAVGYSQTYVSGFQQYLWLGRINDSGTVLWQRSFGHPQGPDGAKFVNITPIVSLPLIRLQDGNLVLAASFAAGTAGIDEGTWLLGFAPDGTIVWQELYPNTLIDALARPGTAGFWRQGRILIKVNSSGSPQWAKLIPNVWFQAAAPTADGGFVAGGTVEGGLENAFELVRMDANGGTGTCSACTSTSVAPSTITAASAITSTAAISNPVTEMEGLGPIIMASVPLTVTDCPASQVPASQLYLPLLCK